MRKILCLFLVVLLCVSATDKKTIKIACLGDSITAGYGIKDANKNSYPAQLAKMLGSDYQVENFGVSGSTVMVKPYASYQTTQQFDNLIQYKPDVVLLCLGTNDASERYRSLIGNFEVDYNTLIDILRAEIPNVRIIVMTPPKVQIELIPSLKGKNFLADTIIPSIRKVAFDNKLELVDLYHLFTKYDKALLSDALHPTAQGAGLISQRLYEQLSIKGEDFNFDTKKIEPTSFHGFDCFTFDFKGKTSHVVKPRVVAEGRPWIWRARFWNNKNANTGLDIALLERGFHLVYTDVSDMFGNKDAVKQFENYYKYLTKGGLSDKCVLEGMSRGGLMIYNFAAKNPEKVAAVYGDAPFLNFNIFADKDRKIGVKEKLFLAYGFKTEQEAVDFPNTPIKNAEIIAKGGYPMIHICGTADQSVPLADNTLLFKKLVEKQGAEFIYIEKPGVAHHPHGLENYEPVVKHILKAVENRK